MTKKDADPQNKEQISGYPWGEVREGQDKIRD